MFHSSTQRRYWMFKRDEDIVQAQRQVHDRFVALHGQTMPEEKWSEHFLKFDEASFVRTFYEKMLVEFCNKFKPPMPKNVMGTALQYYKRFYINNSVMDYHPKEILVTAAYLACKVEEFNVSIEQFIANIKGNKERATDIVLNSELLLMKELGFHLTIHNPFRPVEGLLIDVKARCNSLRDPESLRKDVEIFLDEISLTNAALLYAPSQIALAGIIHAASKNGENMDSYVTSILFGNCDEQRLSNIIDAVRNIRLMAKSVQTNFDPSLCKQYQEKLESCRNQENNPDSQTYKRKLRELFEDEEERNSKFMKMDDMAVEHN